MPNPNLSVLLVVDDADLSDDLHQRLADAGYTAVRRCAAADTLQVLERDPASVLVLNGPGSLALAERVRQLDEMTDLYTYMLLISDAPAQVILDETNDHGIDDVLAPSDVAFQIIGRLLAADRLSSILLRLRQENRLMRQNIASLEQRNLVDALTGLGNARYLRQKIADSLRQIQARGGAICYLLIGIDRAADLSRQHGNDLYDEILQGVGRRLQQMVRPLDTLVRLDDAHFVLMTLPPDLSECAPSSFKRLHDGLNQKAFMTSAGAIEINAGISLVGLDRDCLPVDPQLLFDEARQLLGDSFESGLVSARRLPAKSSS